MSGPSPVDVRNQIVDILSECVYEALGLKESLQDERHALEEQDTDALNTALTIKGVCVNRLKELDSQRANLCETSGFRAGPDQMQKICIWCDQDSIIANCWLHLMEIASDCNALNMTNGAIIQMRQQMIESNLAVLRGTEAVPDTYKREGSRSAAVTRRSLTQA